MRSGAYTTHLAAAQGTIAADLTREIDSGTCLDRSTPMEETKQSCLISLFYLSKL